MMSTPKFKYTASISLITTYLFIITVLLIGAYKFNKVSNSAQNKAINKRYPDLVLAICGSSILVLLSEIIWQLSIIAPESSVHLLFIRIYHGLISLSLSMFLYLIALRFWLIYYDLHWNASVSNSKWIYYLNPTLIDIDFWIKYKTTFGDYNYCKTLALTIYFFVASISFILYQIGLSFNGFRESYSYANLFVTIFYLLPISFSMILYLKLPPFTDNLWIKQEFKISVIILFVCLLCFGPVVICSEFMDKYYSDLLLSIIGIIPHSISFISTFVVSDRMHPIEPLPDLPIMSLVDVTTADSEMDSTETSASVGQKVVAENIEINCGEISTEQAAVENVTAILRHYAEFENLMKYLAEEFSIEYGLALLELVQFKDVLQNEGDHHKKMDLFWNLTEFPKSYIVYKSYSKKTASAKVEGSKGFDIIAKELYAKYIAAENGMGVKISFGVRSKCRDCIDTNVDIKILSAAFDDVIKELINSLEPMYWKSRQISNI